MKRNYSPETSEARREADRLLTAVMLDLKNHPAEMIFDLEKLVKTGEISYLKAIASGNAARLDCCGLMVCAVNLLLAEALERYEDEIKTDSPPASQAATN